MRRITLRTYLVLIGAAVIVGGCAVQRSVNYSAPSRAIAEQDSVALSGPPAGPGGPGGFGAARVSFGGARTARRSEDSASVPEGKAVTLTVLADNRTDRYLIKNATLTVEAKDVRQAATAILTAVRAVGGYVAESHEAVDGLGQRSVTIQVRIPFGRFDPTLRQIETLGRILDKQITAEDVTEEFVDSQAKLRNLKRTEARLLQHLDRTGRLSDTLLVEKELNRVRGEIEQLEGKLRFLAHRVTFSTVTITLQAAPSLQPLVPAETYSTGKEVAGAVRSLVAFGRVLWTTVIWIGVWAVVWVPVVVGLGVVYWTRRNAVVG